MLAVLSLLKKGGRTLHGRFPPQAVLGPAFRDCPVFKLVFLQ